MDWIKCSDRLPRIGQIVYGAIVGGLIGEVYLRKILGKTDWITVLFPQEVVSITHWQPLPEPPKECFDINEQEKYTKIQADLRKKLHKGQITKYEDGYNEGILCAMSKIKEIYGKGESK
jgi:hypothetical protein